MENDDLKIPQLVSLTEESNSSELPKVHNEIKPNDVSEKQKLLLEIQRLKQENAKLKIDQDKCSESLIDNDSGNLKSFNN